jgi:hypothetical protein
MNKTYQEVQTDGSLQCKPVTTSAKHYTAIDPHGLEHSNYFEHSFSPKYVVFVLCSSAHYMEHVNSAKNDSERNLRMLNYAQTVFEGGFDRYRIASWCNTLKAANDMVDYCKSYAGYIAPSVCIAPVDTCNGVKLASEPSVEQQSVSGGGLLTPDAQCLARVGELLLGAK